MTSHTSHNKGGALIAAATLVSSWLVKKLGLDSTMYGLIYTASVEVADNAKAWALNSNVTASDVYQALPSVSFSFNSEKFTWVSWLLLSNWLWITIASIISLYFLYTVIKYLCRPKIKVHPVRATRSIALNKIEEISRLCEYMAGSSQFFSGFNKLVHGDVKAVQAMMNKKNQGDSEFIKYMFESLKTLNQLSIPDSSKQIEIKDTRYNKEGYMTWNKEKITLITSNGDKDEAKTMEDLMFPTVTIVLYTDQITDVTGYLKEIEKYLCSTRQEKVWAWRVLPDRNCKRTSVAIPLADKSDYELEREEKHYIKTFFHPQRDYWWRYAKGMHFHPENFYKYGQVPQMNLLLHGPPGTGKSTFAYRIARALGRHVISLDIRTLTTKWELYQVFTQPYLNKEYHKMKDVVFILDEFDLGVKALHVQLMARNINTTRIDHSMTAMRHHMSTMKDNPVMIQDFIDSDDEKDDTSTEESKKDDTSTEESKKDDASKKKKDPMKSLQKVVDKSKKGFLDVDVSSYNSDKPTLQDLLEIFQGPIPNEQAIIIATTNHFEQIKDLCPALFRPGRLTPVYFGHPTRDTIEEISQYYFEKPCGLELPDVLEVATSKIIEICISATLTEAPYQFFQEKLTKVLESLK